MRIILILISLSFLVLSCDNRQAATGIDSIPLPSTAQLRYQNYERTMFLCLDPCTWQGREYDNHSTELSEMKLSALNTDQWCEVAQSWGAKLILFVAKHTGGFCWWQTETSDYSVKNIPWKDGKGDLLAELSKSCKKYGLDMGIYVYPGDDTWGAGIGSGGRTSDSSKQEGYNKIFRAQLTEVLTKYGPMQEVWFDGSCVIDVSDILEKYASDAVILQGPQANLRWVGNENGIAPDPNWYTLMSSDLETGVSTAVHSDPDGDAYAPVEMDVPLMINGGHKWFWGPDTEHLLPGLDKLMEIYYKSAGRGGVLLLNSTPDTSGLIPSTHVDLYRAFGEEIARRFSRPLGETKGKGIEFVIDFGKELEIDHAVICEDLQYGQRVREYVLEYFDAGGWKHIYSGTSIGSKKIDRFSKIRTKKIRLRITNTAATPIIKSFEAFFVGMAAENQEIKESQSFTIGSWNPSAFSEDWSEIEFDLTPYVDMIGQYEISFELVSRDFDKDSGLEFRNWRLDMYGNSVPQAIEKKANAAVFIITRSQQTQVIDEFPTILRIEIRTKPGRSTGTVELRKIRF